MLWQKNMHVWGSCCCLWQAFASGVVVVGGEGREASWGKNKSGCKDGGCKQGDGSLLLWYTGGTLHWWCCAGSRFRTRTVVSARAHTHTNTPPSYPPTQPKVSLSFCSCSPFPATHFGYFQQHISRDGSCGCVIVFCTSFRFVLDGS